MNCFQLVKEVLDELYESMPGASEEEKDKNIRRGLRYLEAKYIGLARGEIINYAHPAIQFAYIYKYLTSHVNLVYQIIASSDLAEMFEQKRINITSVGGGPGSDILGILKYILTANQEPSLRCTILDRKTVWEHSCNIFIEKLNPNIQFTNIFQTFDVVDSRTWATTARYLNSDLFIMSYFMSEIDSLRVGAEPFFAHLFGNAKAGSLFLYIDNNSSHFYNWFDSLASAHHLEVLRSGEGRMGITDYSEEKTDLGKYYEKFDSPKIRSDIAFRICRKN